MTQIIDRAAPASRLGGPTQLDLTDRQLRAIDALNAARRRTQDRATAGGSRETRMDLARNLEVLQREHEALVARIDAQLRCSGAPGTATGRRIVLAHRNAWFVDRVCASLQQHGVEIVACLDNGADAVGTTLAEQPDLVLVEDRIAMISGEDVVREVRRHCPDTLVAAHVDHGDRVAALLDAGADAVFTRQAPPADVAEALQRLLAG